MSQLFTPYMSLYGAHPMPGRPWWRYTGEAWTRPDGETCRTPQQAQVIDRTNPLPMPPLLPGQVWATPQGSYLILSVIQGGGVYAPLVEEAIPSRIAGMPPRMGAAPVLGLITPEQLTAPGLALVQGVGAPWMVEEGADVGGEA